MKFSFFITKIPAICFIVSTDRLSGWHLYAGSYNNCNLISLPSQVRFRWIINHTALCFGGMGVTPILPPTPNFCISLPLIHYFYFWGQSVFLLNDKCYFTKRLNQIKEKESTATWAFSAKNSNISNGLTLSVLDDHSKLFTVQFYIHPFTHTFIQCIY